MSATAQQFVAVPLATFRMMERAAKKMLSEESNKPKERQWMSARPFARATGKNKEALRYFRNKFPHLVQKKEGQTEAYLYDFAGYQELNLTAK